MFKLCCDKMQCEHLKEWTQKFMGNKQLNLEGSFLAKQHSHIDKGYSGTNTQPNQGS